MAIVTHHHLPLRELRFAAPARVRVWKGAATLKSGGVAVELQEGESFTVPPFVRFACLAHPRVTAQGMRPAVWSLSLEAQSSADMERAADTSKPHARRLAAAIFAQPAAQWCAERIAREWQISTARLRALLFAEGESLRSLVREQRVAWVLAQLARMEDARARPSDAGFASQAALQRACQDLIGLPPGIAERALSLLSSQPRAALPPPQEGQSRQRRYRPYF
ncbi:MULTISPECIES: hypothetical protein [unclassified Herbaspirillum]|jgi:methylphosphotriester-DNA--protein-cysteine methyltransferase|uniref:hypothetical protein n=1 Tax=unclassified Herbaspirillum TaxID=2624150 RepID=UPI001584FA30|nr:MULTISPECIES: hypothetical protein [unclassified Herbaspirillum]MCI1005413.1 hypothetical protein [Herbaspirillum sp. C7C8]NUT63482.1 hypothetical protein [Herbaspirillum sp. C9C3]